MKEGGKREHLVAVTRQPSANLAECELSFVHRQPIDLARARAEHAGHCAALRAAGVEVVVLPPLDALPDAVFVEDTAVVVDEIAVLAAPGVPTRAAESEMMVSTLADRFSTLTPPGHALDRQRTQRYARTWPGENLSWFGSPCPPDLVVLLPKRHPDRKVGPQSRGSLQSPRQPSR